jgi:drug/metabolite transporter (DMT)-like permease
MFAVAFKTMSPILVAWFKNLIAFIALGICALIFISEPVPATNLSWLGFSGFLGLGIGDWLYFLAIAHIGVGRTVIISQAVPALTALCAWQFLGENLSSWQIWGVALVIGGGIVAESRKFGRNNSNRFDNIGLIAAISCTLLWTIANLAAAQGMKDVAPLNGGAIRLAAGTLFFALWFIKDGTFISNLKFSCNKSTWRKLAVPTIIGACLGNFLNMAAFKWATPGIASSLSSTVPVFAIPLSAWILKEKPGLFGWSGAVLVIIGALLVGGLIG